MKQRFAVVALVAHLLIGALITTCEATLYAKLKFLSTSMPVAKDDQNESGVIPEQSPENQSSLNRIHSFSDSSSSSPSPASPPHLQAKVPFERVDSFSSASSSTLSAHFQPSNPHNINTNSQLKIGHKSNPEDKADSPLGSSLTADLNPTVVNQIDTLPPKKRFSKLRITKSNE
ncbi:hypothetical protein niasHS_001910 [Heterodera schachtii]|uniref:Uncharacterized protein n=1 Tax=Heterodera schachtii TaxID=97005 RepID=A0ABD2KBU7_HETSC